MRTLQTRNLSLPRGLRRQMGRKQHERVFLENCCIFPKFEGHHGRKMSGRTRWSRKAWKICQVFLDWLRKRGSNLPDVCKKCSTPKSESTSRSVSLSGPWMGKMLRLDARLAGLSATVALAVAVPVLLILQLGGSAQHQVWLPNDSNAKTNRWYHLGSKEHALAESCATYSLAIVCFSLSPFFSSGCWLLVSHFFVRFGQRLSDKEKQRKCVHAHSLLHFSIADFMASSRWSCPKRLWQPPLSQIHPRLHTVCMTSFWSTTQTPSQSCILHGFSPLTAMKKKCPMCVVSHFHSSICICMSCVCTDLVVLCDATHSSHTLLSFSCTTLTCKEKAPCGGTFPYSSICMYSCVMFHSCPMCIWRHLHEHVAASVVANIHMHTHKHIDINNTHINIHTFIHTNTYT